MSAARQRLNKQVLLAKGYARNKRGTVGGGVFCKVHAKVTAVVLVTLVMPLVEAG
jgi:hypothetical protein